MIAPSIVRPGRYLRYPFQGSRLTTETWRGRPTSSGCCYHLSWSETNFNCVNGLSSPFVTTTLWMVIHDGCEKRFPQDCLVWEQQCLISAIAEASLASVALHREFPSFGNCRGIAGQRWSALRLTKLWQLPTELY